MKLLTQFFLFIALFSALSAQTPEHQLLVRWEEPGAGKAPELAHLVGRDWLSAKLAIELLTFTSADQANLAFEELLHCTCVRALEINQEVSFRADPNDPFYEDQRTNFSRAGYAEAWELTPGGTTLDGQEIVVAILDAGFDVDHEDLRENLWTNQAEVLNDGIDNDENGYVDDRFGWDMVEGSPDLPNDAHGTQVIGLLGAKGDNGVGVSGSNWDLKMMLLSIRTTAHIVEAYEYVLEQRRRYNATEGREGAFVVATNASFGVEGATCADFSVWGGLYDELGKEGILTAASTANRNFDVDTFGDMPTDCPSDYLLGVANVGPNDLLWRSSGFGRESVDLGAPGEGSYSTRPGDQYASFGSTSAAAPYVTGAIALLYATPCPEFLAQVKTDPEGAALLVRSALLTSTTDNASLAFRTSTGGTLNIVEAQRVLASRCDGAAPENFAIAGITPNPATDFAIVETNGVVFGRSGRIDLFDLAGRHVRSLPAQRIGFNPVRLRVSVAGLPSGMYLLQVTERDRVARLPIIKQ